MSLKFKEGVELTITKEVNEILSGVHLAFLAIGKECVVTSGRDGQHMEGSKHYEGKAIDFRTFHLHLHELDAVVKAAKNALGKDFDVVVEGDHLHVEKDPKVV